MESFVIALNAVVPFLAYMSVGFLVRKVGIVDTAFLKKLNNMVFKAFFPFMMFYSMYNKDRDLTVNPRMVLTALISLGLFLLLSILIVPRLVDGPKRQGVIIQAIYRSNFVLFAVPLMATVFGDNGTAIATMMIAIVIPVYNVIAVVLLEYCGNSGKKSSVLSLLKGVLRNPLILGALVGLVFYALRIRLPLCLEKPISQFSALTTPLALFVLGGTLTFKSLVHNLKYLIPTCLFKLIVLPAIMLVVVTLLHFSPVERFLIFCMYGTPVAASSYPMAQSMGCDGDLAGEFVVLSTVLSVVTIFLWVFLLSSMGLL